MAVSVAVIGLGRIGSGRHSIDESGRSTSHIGSILNNKLYNLIAVSDTSQEKIDQCIYDWNLNIPTFTEVPELLANVGTDVLVISSPPVAHLNAIKAACDFGVKVIFCEKPFCASIDEATEAVERANASGPEIIVNFHRRWSPKIQAFKSHLSKLGWPIHVQVVYGKGLYNYGSHIVELLTNLLGEINAINPIENSHVNRQDPSRSAVLEFKSGVKACVFGLDDASYDLFDIDFFYPQEKYSLIAGGYKIKRSIGIKNLYFKDYCHLGLGEDLIPPGPVGGFEQAYVAIADFLLCGKHHSGITGADAVRIWTALRKFEL